MGLFKRITNWQFGSRSKLQSERRVGKSAIRSCRFEELERRCVLSADPVIAGITYLEGDIGQDTTPDYFEITFQGGSTTTQLTQFTINGDQDLSGGLSDGDMFFDIDSSQPGTGGYAGFQFDASNSQGVSAADILSYDFSDDGLILTVNVRNFEAGDVLAFTADVDEVERFRTDKIASGVEYESTLFDVVFVDEHYNFTENDLTISTTLEGGYVQDQESGFFYDYYDDLFQASGQLAGESLNLDADNETGAANRSAGAVAAYDLIAKPISISGNVFHDENLDCFHDANEQGIGGVTIHLQQLGPEGQYQTVATTTTDANGHYEFGTELGLTPGTYRLIEMQPEGFLDVGATAGRVNGSGQGQVTNNADGNANVIGDIHIPLGNTAATDYNFCEVRPATLSGYVWHDRNDDGIRDSGEEGIADVLIRITRVGAKDDLEVDPFANFDPIFVRTDANGHYQVQTLPPGIYEILEVNNYPNQSSPLANYIDGKDSLGRINGNTVGNRTNDRMDQIVLCASDKGLEFNFGELRPTEISGYVSVASPEGDCVDPASPDHQGIAGVTIELYGSNGQLVQSTTTDDDGRYEFGDLPPGTYTVVEVQPNGYLDGAESVGQVDGTQTGRALSNDGFTGITLASGEQGTNYNFCEHLPAEVNGTVYHDRNDNGVQNQGEEGIADVVIELYDDSGNLVAQQRTDPDGHYRFANLYAGNYTIREIQPAGYVDGIDSLGRVRSAQATEATVGVLSNDQFAKVTLRGGDKGIEYNFGELRLGSISGFVHADADGDCHFDADQGDRPLSGVTLILLDVDGNELQRTTTDANGRYEFAGLRPGEYSVREITPDGYIDGEESVGSVMGVQVGNATNDLIRGIRLTSGDAAVEYNFCEHIPAELCGTVYHDRNNNGIQDDGEEGIGDTLVQLFDTEGNLIAQQRTAADGNYCFTDLVAGEYKIREVQPEGFVDGKDSLGLIDGVRSGEAENDLFCVEIRGGQLGQEYNFGELQLASIHGYVYNDVDGNCVFDREGGENPLSGVTIELLDAEGKVIASTVTNERGGYRFRNLLPGEYSLRQIQPDNYFSVGQVAGVEATTRESGSGNTSTVNQINGIQIQSGQRLVQYNFCEAEAAEIHGRVWEDGPSFVTSDGTLPENYRSQRDGVFTSGTDTPIAGVRMQLYFYIDLQAGLLEPRPVTLSDVLPGHYDHIRSSDPNTPIWTTTDANGNYSFTGLPAGSYIVLEQQPAGYSDANDIPGTTEGFTYNSAAAAVVAPRQLTRIFTANQIMDSVVNIQLSAGDVSLSNNFTEVRAIIGQQSTPVLDPPVTPPTLTNPLTPQPGIAGLPALYGAQPVTFSTYVGISTTFIAQPSGEAYSWHLSVINAGQPRSLAESQVVSESVWRQTAALTESDWTRFDMSSATWSFTETSPDGTIVPTEKNIRFGMYGGLPLAGDFDGDGVDEIAVFHEGYWMIDINRNGRWDDMDLMARLGDANDRPVVGDWDGDGKDDIGIYGPMWERDLQAIINEPGLPNPDNLPRTDPKNIPPDADNAAYGARTMKLTSYGRQRADVVDHVFGTGNRNDIPVTGDWNGNGIRSIGMFNAGVWQLDVNGDGDFDSQDQMITFGRDGDIPLVGDFDGDGIEEIAVYRSGTWLIDTNGNRELDATDKTFELGGVEDTPVIGDWDGDGIDEPGLYHSTQVGGLYGSAN